MIIATEDEAVHSAKTIEAKSDTIDVPAADLPPAYPGSSSSIPPPRLGLSANVGSTPPPVAQVKPTNFVSIDRRDGAIKNKFIIDPSISIPVSLRPSLAADETEDTRKNLKLIAKNGSVDVDVTLIGAENTTIQDAKRKKRITLHIDANNGSVKINLRTNPESMAQVPIPFHLKIIAHNGSVTVRLPRSFEGLMTICAKNGGVRYSDDVSERMSMHNEEKSTRRCFLGDLASFSDENGGWNGDELAVEADNGSVKIHFVDEVDSNTSKGKGSFLSRLFS